MSKREEFITVIDTLKALSPTITSEQRKALLQQAVQQHSLSVEDANEILKTSGLIVGERINCFEVLGFSFEELQNQSEKNIATQVDAAHKKFYSESLRAGGLPRRDGRTQEQWLTLLNQARDTLKDPQKRQKYLTALLFPEDLSEISSHDTSNPESGNQNSATATNAEPISVPKPSSVDSAKVVPTPNASGDMMLIPAGDFQMGSNDDKADNSEKPLHTVYLDAFYMDKHLVTNAQYMEFVAANPQWHKPSKWYEWGNKQKMSIAKRYHDGDYLKHWDENIYPEEKAEHPVTWVSWYAAMAYSKWVGKRLPTEAEWEKAARGGLTDQKYPWGDFADPSMANYDWNVGDTTPVGQYPANGYGLYDMVGNVWEWCLDVFDADFYMRSPYRNPISGANTDESVADDTLFRVLRGGSWLDAQQFMCSALHYKNTPTRTLARIGFRCVKAVTS
ncbi:formylglycine-generating enzyme family protein [Candidatus Poribacteria bacterium]|nr:formylglycine-generating enzyme family protein [Candidatus Poribacteria bacterium]